MLTYKKLATLSACLGFENGATLYYEKVEKIMLRERENKSLTAEQRKVFTEDLSKMYFQQYMQASTSEDIDKQIEYISKQTACQIEITGERSSQVCSNTFLVAHLQIKLGRLTEAMANNEKIMGMFEDLKADFGEDYAIICSKFYLQKANLQFFSGKLEEAKQTAVEGVKLVKQVKNIDDEGTRSATMRCLRDLLNLIVRIRTRLEGGNSAAIRKQVSEENGVGITFMKLHDEKVTVPQDI